MTSKKNSLCIFSHSNKYSKTSYKKENKFRLLFQLYVKLENLKTEQQTSLFFIRYFFKLHLNKLLQNFVHHFVSCIMYFLWYDVSKTYKKHRNYYNFHRTMLDSDLLYLTYMITFIVQLKICWFKPLSYRYLNCIMFLACFKFFGWLFP